MSLKANNFQRLLFLTSKTFMKLAEVELAEVELAEVEPPDAPGAVSMTL